MYIQEKKEASVSFIESGGNSFMRLLYDNNDGIILIISKYCCTETE